MDVRDDVVILDARPAEAFAAGHLEGALHAGLETQLSAASVNDDPARGGRHPLPPIERWIEQVKAWGIGPATRVVIYDDQNGANAAARAWWMLRAIGHENVEVLTDWKSDGAQYAVPRSAVPRSAVPRSAGILPAGPPASSPLPSQWTLPTVGMQQVDRLRHDPDWRLLDVRSAPRFRGETEPIDPVAGHIPGAVNLFFGENLEEGQFKSPEALREQYRELLGGVPPERLIVHCGSGVTACHTLLALDRAGLHGASLYVGSWGEWCRNDMPVARD